MTNPVLDLLVSRGHSPRTQGKDFVIKCLNPDHDDSNPSFRVDQTTGIAHCFSCGFKTNVFKFYGVIGNFTSIKIAKLKEKLKSVNAAFRGQDMPLGATQISRTFRGISLATLRHFEAFTTYQVDELQDRICFPIYDVRERIALFQARHSLSDQSPKYVNYPSGVELPIYPTKYDKTYKSAVLVEGLFDMLNLYDKGCRNVTCVFGTNNLYKDLAIKLLPLKSQGVSKLFILFDGDDAGNTAAEKIKPLLEEQEFEVEIIKLPKGMDPGNLDSEYVDSIVEYMNDENTA